jgi:integrase
MATISKRVSKDNLVSYQAKVRLKGYPVQSATFSRKTDAQRWVQDTESAIRDGRYFKTSEAKRHTLADLIDRYIENVLPCKGSNLKQQKNQKMQLLEWKDRIGERVLADVTPALLAETRDAMLHVPIGNQGKTRSGATVARYMAILSHAFTIAVNEWSWLDDSPMRKVKKPSEPRGRVRYLSEEEIQRLLDACKASECPYLHPVVVLALSTGMRRGEILNLRWKDVDLERGQIILHETKNNERRNVPVSRHASEVLHKLSKVRRIDTTLLFPANAKGSNDVPFVITKPWVKALEAAGIEDFRFHDLRHTAASYLAMNGASIAEIAEVLGHKSLQMVKRYAHLSAPHTSKVVASMNDRMFGEC